MRHSRGWGHFEQSLIRNRRVGQGVFTPPADMAQLVGRRIMRTLKTLTIVAALLAAGVSLAMAQAGPLRRAASHLWPAARRACKLHPDRTFGYRLHLIPQAETREGCTCRRSTSFRAAVQVCRPMQHAAAGPELAAAHCFASPGNGATIRSQRSARSKSCSHCAAGPTCAASLTRVAQSHRFQH